MKVLSVIALLISPRMRFHNDSGVVFRTDYHHFVAKEERTHRQNEKYVGKVNFDASRVCVGREAGECVWSAYVYFEFTSNFRVFHDVFLTWNHAL